MSPEAPKLTPPVIPPVPGDGNDELYAVVENPLGRTVQYEELPLSSEPTEQESNDAAYYISIGANPDGVAPGTDVQNYENGQQWLRSKPLEWRVGVLQD